MTPKEELKRWERVRIEPDYMVIGPDVHEDGDYYEVMDAECERIGRFRTEDMAEVVAAALRLYDDRMWEIREGSPRHSEEQDK